MIAWHSTAYSHLYKMQVDNNPLSVAQESVLFQTVSQVHSSKSCDLSHTINILELFCQKLQFLIALSHILLIAFHVLFYLA